MAVRERDGKPIEEILSAGEQRVFRELVAGATDEEISERLNLGITTVRYHIRNSIRRMEVADRAALLALGSGAAPQLEPEADVEPSPSGEGLQAVARETGGSRSRGLPVWLLPVVVVVAVGA
ncbi:MAG: helix-turn-helix transcriptional regulator, partial [Dehalococcoidia bacterium]|nr:helix-turn-helix transcriptional regulator [Dehalococcoidia bacterium]